MDELEAFARTIGSLGLPGWVLIFTVILIVLNYLGVLPVIVEGMKAAGASIAGGLTAKQTLMARLIDKALDQNVGLIGFIKDQLLAKVEELGEKQEQTTARLASLETHVRFITYYVTEQKRTTKGQDDEGLFRLVSELQEKVGALEAELRRAKQEPPVEK